MGVGKEYMKLKPFNLYTLRAKIEGMVFTISSIDFKKKEIVINADKERTHKLEDAEFLTVEDKEAHE
jgi:hypothetical protein